MRLEGELLVTNTNNGGNNGGGRRGLQKNYFYRGVWGVVRGSLLPLFLLILPHFLYKNPKSWL